MAIPPLSLILSVFLVLLLLSSVSFFATSFERLRRERGKIKESPHTLPSNIIRLSLMALLEYLPCVCVFVCMIFLCVYFFNPCLSDGVSFMPVSVLCVLVYECQYVPRLPLARGPIQPLGRPAISPSILSKTSKLPSSAVHEGAALCLMSLLFCSDLPPPKPPISTVIHSS